jgi:hypothetical protein
MVKVNGWSILSALVLFYFKLGWIDKFQIMIESRIAQWQIIIEIAEAGIKVWGFFYIIKSQEMTRFDQVAIIQCMQITYVMCFYQIKLVVSTSITTSHNRGEWRILQEKLLSTLTLWVRIRLRRRSVLDMW